MKKLIVGLMLTLSCAMAHASTSYTLLFPGNIAFQILGHSCGGIQEQSAATAFDQETGNPVGYVYLQTRCGGSGRGGGYRTTTYSAWVSVMWGFQGNIVTYTLLSSAPADFPSVPRDLTNLNNNIAYTTLTLFDPNGNELYDTQTVINNASCSVGNTAYCTYRAHLLVP